MPPPTLLLVPDSASYAGKFGAEAVATKLDGGASRYRSDFLGATFIVDVQWTCNLTNYNYLTAFFRTAVNRGADPFIIGLLLDSGIAQNYTVHFVPATFGLISFAGDTYVVGAQLEAIPDPTYDDSDATIISAGPDTI